MAFCSGKLREYPRHFAGVHLFGYAVVVVEGGEGAPAYVDGGDAAPAEGIHHGGELFPVVDRLEVERLDRRAGHYNSIGIVAPAEHFGGRDVESVDMLLSGVAAPVGGGSHEGEADIKGRRGEEPDKIGLGHLLERHEIDQSYAQWASGVGRGET